jgi:hypothetical protein
LPVESFPKPSRLDLLKEDIENWDPPPYLPPTVTCAHPTVPAEAETLREMGAPSNSRLVFCTLCGWTWEYENDF